MANIVKIKRFADTCKRGHNRWGKLPRSHNKGPGGRYCLDCANYRVMRTKIRKGLSISLKSVALMDSKVDFEISYLENQIRDLENQIVELRKEKEKLRLYIEKEIERKKAK